MSAVFWINFFSAICVFVGAIVLLQLYKSEVVRGIRARFLRRKLMPLLNKLLMLLSNQLKANDHGVSALQEDYTFMRYRADLEAIYQRSEPLFNQERLNIAALLASLSTLMAICDNKSVETAAIEKSVLLSQRVMQELNELGL